MTKILLLGKDGQLGTVLAAADWFAGDVVAFGKAECDLSDAAALRARLRETAPDIIVNAAAYTAVDRAEDEPDMAFAVNAEAPGIIAAQARALDAVLIHYSTDYVFDGLAAEPHVETDPAHPLGVYGASKLAGEQAIAASGCRHVILRTSWVYSAHGRNFARTMLRLGQEKDSLSVVDDQWGAPTPVNLLSAVTGRFVDLAPSRLDPGDPVFGLYHCAASGRTNWRDYAAFLLSSCIEAGLAVRVDPGRVLGIPSEAYPTKAQRPKNSLLSSAKLEQTLGMEMPDWRTGVRDLAREWAREWARE